jgi:hypothetical protein
VLVLLLPRSASKSASASRARSGRACELSLILLLSHAFPILALVLMLRELRRFPARFFQVMYLHAVILTML